MNVKLFCWRHRHLSLSFLLCLSLSCSSLLPLGLLGDRLNAQESKPPSSTQAGAEDEKFKDPGLEKLIQQSQSQLQQKKAEVEKLKKESLSIQQQLAKLSEETEASRKERDRLQQKLAFARESLNEKLLAQEKAAALLLQKRKEYQERLATLFYYRKRSTWEILLQSKGLSGFFSNLRMIAAIAETDEKLYRELLYAEQVSKEQSALAEKSLNAFSELLTSAQKQLEKLEEGLVDLEESQKQLDQSLLQRGSEEQDLEKTLAEQMAAQAQYVANSKALAAQIEKMEQEKRKKAAQAQGNLGGQQNSSGNTETETSTSGSKPSGFATARLSGQQQGKGVWPLPSGSEIWSPYGWRDTDFDRANGYLHTGVDIASPTCAGQPVVAAWSGIVVNAVAPSQGQMYAPQANYVQINHGDGFGSGYWHLQSVLVSVGQYVEAGQIIGYCGSTGMSTGPHLHFEVYDENNPNRALRNTVNPLPYLR